MHNKYRMTRHSLAISSCLTDAAPFFRYPVIPSFFFVVKAINIIFPRIWNESVELDHIRSCVSFSPCVQIMCHIQPLRNGRPRGKYKQLPSTYLNPCRCQVIATRNSDTNLVIWRGLLVSFSLLFSTEVFSSSIGCSRNRFLFLVQIPLNLQF